MTKEYIIETCKKYNIRNYTINDDLSIDVKGDVYLSGEGLTELPLTFNIVDGGFHCSYNELTSLKGSPRKCENFYCYGNNLINLEGAPDECEYFSCWDNYLTSLKGAPKCDIIIFEYIKLDLDNEELYIIEALVNYYVRDNDLKDYLKIRQRNDIINSILN